MRIILTAAFALLIVAGFIAYMSSFTVRFNQAAVVTTFGQATSTDVIREPGLRFKWPAPVQSVTVYDVRARFLTSRSETQQTADDRQIVAEAFLTWRVEDPLVFYQRFRGSSGADARDHLNKAEEQLQSLLRSAMAEVSKYTLGELFSPESGASKLPALEQDILARLRAPAEQGGSNITQYGLAVDVVGVSSVVLPEQTTKEVFARMSESRKRLAAKAESEGEALATSIRRDAENAAKRIREFARLRADQIRSQGDLDAAPFLSVLNEDPQLAVFLAELDLFREGLGKQATLIFQNNEPGVGLFSAEAFERARRGELAGMAASGAAVPKPAGAPAQGAAEPRP